MRRCPAKRCDNDARGKSVYETLTDQEWNEVDRIWEQLEDGAIAEAREGILALLEQRGPHPDLRVLEAAIAIEDGHAEQALLALRDAEASADPALFFQLRAVARFNMVEVETARSDAEQALAIRPEMPESHALLSRIADFVGDREAAREHARMAFELDPEGFPLPLDVGDDDFDRLVEASLGELPERVRERLDEIPLVVDPMPAREILIAEHPPFPPDILGLFVGRHLLARSHSDLPESPGTIHLFRRNLLRVCQDREELAREVRVTVQHEVGHLLGLDEDDLEAWGLA